MNFLQALQYCIDNRLIFAAYRLPHSDAIKLVVQKSPTSHAAIINSELFDQKGFILSPFLKSEKFPSYFIQPDLVYSSTNYLNFDELLQVQHPDQEENIYENGVIGKKEFKIQVESIIEAIRQNKFKKAVLSRTKVLERNYRCKLKEIFQLLSTSYTNAFVYMVNVGGQFWMGATPEPLLCAHKNELETVSLAGTKPYNDENLNITNWSHKDQVEQELVTQYIEETFENRGFQFTQKNGPYTKKAGNLVHLRTDFTYNLTEVGKQLGELVSELHPTPAVCGLPKQAAMDFIQSIEKHQRSYYSGFLGPVNIDDKLQLFVNLRCMQVMDERLILYIGAGITSESDAEEEWNETEIKADTLLSVIHKV